MKNISGESKTSDSKHHVRAKTCTQPLALNVVFHGMFAFVMWDHCVEVLVPEVTGHTYKAGNVMPPLDPSGNCRAELKLLQSGATYRLAGAFADTKKSLDPAKNVVLSNRRMIDRSQNKVHCGLWLPHPDQIYSLGCVQCDIPGLKFFSGVDAGEVQSTELALLQVFVYENLDDRGPSLQPDIGWTPVMNECCTNNLHVFAEPPMKMRGPESTKHQLEAADALFSLFAGLDLHLKPQNDPEPPGCLDAKVYGIGPCDKKDLAQLCHSMSAEGIDIHHCLSLSVNNSGS